MNTDKKSEMIGAFERCPHDKENPYSMVSNALIRSKDISPECIWLLTYLLSHKPGWVIHPKQILAHLKGKWGRDKLYKVINEGIKEGYIKREPIPLFRSNFKYIISEEPKFKKSLQRTENQDAGNKDAENKDSKEDYNSSYSEEYKNNYQEEERVPKIAKKKKEPDSYIELSDEEKKLLQDEIGPEMTEKCIKHLTEWKKEKPKSKWTKSDYDSIHRWVWYAVKEQEEKEKRYGKSKKIFQEPVNEEDAKKNKKNSEIIERKLNARFTSNVLFQALPDKAVMLNKHKDFYKEYPYKNFSLKDFNELILKDLEVCFPGSKDILLGKSDAKVASVIAGIVGKTKFE